MRRLLTTLLPAAALAASLFLPANVSAQTLPEFVGEFPACFDLGINRAGDICVWSGVGGDPRWVRISPDGSAAPDGKHRLLAVIRSDNPQNPTIDSLRPVAYLNRWIVTVRVPFSTGDRYMVALDYSEPTVFPWLPDGSGPNVASPFWEIPWEGDPDLQFLPPEQAPVPVPGGACAAVQAACPQQGR